jgi:1-acyl-sn-glycerol-3-phosphate acyltransferase
MKKLWRVAATAWCFAYFGLSGFCLLFSAMPFLWLTVRDRVKREAIARRFVSHSFRVFVGMMQGLGVMTLRFEGVERLKRKGLLIVANHPSLIDVVCLIAQMENANCVVKTSAWKNIFMIAPIRMCGYIRNDSGDLIGECVASIKRGDNLIIFPEGTRTSKEALEKGEVNPLKRGAARIALAGHFAATPVVITVSEPVLTKQGHWFDGAKEVAHFVFETREDIPAGEWQNPEKNSAAQARFYTRQLTGFFNGALHERINRRDQVIDH